MEKEEKTIVKTLFRYSWYGLQKSMKIIEK
jgi:hypothetical protein